jgi:hypothetical protein
VNVAEWVDSGSGIVKLGAEFVSSGNTDTTYDEGSADVAVSPDDHVTLIVVLVDVALTSNG